MTVTPEQVSAAITALRAEQVDADRRGRPDRLSHPDRIRAVMAVYGPEPGPTDPLWEPMRHALIIATQAGEDQ